MNKFAFQEEGMDKNIFTSDFMCGKSRHGPCISSPKDEATTKKLLKSVERIVQTLPLKKPEKGVRKS